MARRADHTREELKELIIQAGFDLIEADGFAAFSARKLASQVGYTVGTIYNVFGSYDELMLHTNARTLDEWYEVMKKALTKQRKGNGIHILARAYIDYSRSHYQRWLTLFEYHVSDDFTLPPWYQDKLNRFFALVEDTLLPLLQNNHRKAARAARILWAGIHGICVLSLSGKLDLVKTDSPEEMIVSFVDHYLMGLAHKKQ